MDLRRRIKGTKEEWERTTITRLIQEENPITDEVAMYIITMKTEIQIGGTNLTIINMTDKMYSSGDPNLDEINLYLQIDGRNPERRQDIRQEVVSYVNFHGEHSYNAPLQNHERSLLQTRDLFRICSSLKISTEGPIKYNKSITYAKPDTNWRSIHHDHMNIFYLFTTLNCCSVAHLYLNSV